MMTIRAACPLSTNQMIRQSRLTIVLAVRSIKSEGDAVSLPPAFGRACSCFFQYLSIVARSGPCPTPFIVLQCLLAWAYVVHIQASML
jgi:hypothetical protein